jgi:hypothetical protein
MMKTAIRNRLFFLFFFSFFFTSIAGALDYTEITTTLSDAFISLTDGNEGTTSFRSLQIPSGGRAESLGSAYTGLADDIGFFDYNPAASCLLKNTELSLFHNAWISDSALETLAGTIRNGNLGLGAEIRCFYVPFTEYNLFGERTAGSYYSETTAVLNASYNFLAGYTFKGLAVGINVKGAWRSIPDYTDDNTDAIISGSGLAQSGLAVIGDIGIMMQFNIAKFFISRDPNLRIGLSFMNAGISFTGFGSSSGITLDDPLPTSIGTGISYRIIKPLILTADFRQPINLQNIQEYEKWSAGGGISVQITDFFAILGGFYLKGANPRISLGSEFEIKKVQFNVNYTLDLTSSLNPVNHFSLAAKINLGDHGRAEQQKQIDTLYNEGLTYFSQGEFDEAIATWKEVLEIDRFFDPAINGIKSAKNQLLLYQKIRDAQFLD